MTRRHAHETMTTTTDRARLLGHPRLGWRIKAAVAVARAWRRRSRTRRQLFRLETRQLRDIGISEDDRRQECAKWFWQV